jgi:hypothetical protein
LLTALAAVGRTYLSAGAGFIAEATGWVWFFAICALAATPGLLVLAWLQRTGHFERISDAERARCPPYSGSLCLIAAASVPSSK